MSIKINNFGGPLIWLFRKYCSNITSRIMLFAVSKKYLKDTDEFIQNFLHQENIPIFQNVMIETINRCNGICEFCPANKNDETRPFKKMTDDMYYGIINELQEMEWSGKLFLCVNNEPFLDKRIITFAQYAKMKILSVSIVLITNGSLLTNEKMDEMLGIVDEIIINDYSQKYILSRSIKGIYKYVKEHPNKFNTMKITINRRYNKEILATRAGNAPNKKNKNVKMKISCLYPFTDFVVFPDGQVGMCCNDCKECSCFGDISNNKILDIWKNKKYQNLRYAISKGRDKYEFCKECDVVDAGEREEYIKSIKWNGM
jgi:Predicted Fe-S oxidoreductases